MEAFVGTYELVHVEICFRWFSFASFFFFPLTLAAGETSIFREFLRSRTVPHFVHVSNKELKMVNLFLRDPSSFHSFWYSHDFVSQDVVGRHAAQHRSVVALDHFRLHLCKITGPKLPNRIWSLEDKVFQELLTCRFQRLQSNLLHQWLFRFRYKFGHDNRCTFSLCSKSDESNLRIKAFLPFFAAQNLFLSTNFLKAIIEGAAATFSLWFSVFFSAKMTSYLFLPSLLVNVFSVSGSVELWCPFFLVQGWNWMLAFCAGAWFPVISSVCDRVARRFFPFARNL